MSFLDNLKIRTKSLIPVVLMAVLIGGISAVATANLGNVTTIADETITRTDPALLYVARTNRLVTALALDVYKALNYDSAAPEMKAVVEEFPVTMASIDDLLASIREMLPSHVADVDAIVADYQSVKGELQAQFDAGVQADSSSPEGAAIARAQIPVDLHVAAFSNSLKTFTDSVFTESEAQAQRLAEASSTAVWAILGLGAFSVVAGLGLALLLTTKTISGPIGRLNAVMRELAGGNSAVEVTGLGRKDEIGQMAHAVESFKQAAIESLRLGEVAETARSTVEQTRLATEQEKARIEAVRAALAEQQAKAVEALGVGLGRLAEGDLTATIATPFEGDLDRLRHAYNDTVTKFASIVTELRETSGALKTATGEILSGANDLAERTTKQAAAIEETSAAMEQLGTTVVENAKRAEQASNKAQTVSDTAALTGEVMTKSNAAMERISSSSAKISNIIGLIDDIAFQTNLLALNASVEAARAGDAGKGFAVVAVEVRRLAQSAASASSEVKVLIEQSASEVSSGSKLVAEATQKLVDMLGSVKESADLIKEISSASREQSSAIAEVSTAIRQMDEMTQHNAALVEETNAAIEQTEGQATRLDQIVEVFVVSGSATRTAAYAAPSQPSRPAASATGIRALQQKVKAAASSYLSKGNAALKEEWSEF